MLLDVLFPKRPPPVLEVDLLPNNELLFPNELVLLLFPNKPPPEEEFVFEEEPKRLLPPPDPD